MADKRLEEEMERRNVPDLIRMFLRSYSTYLLYANYFPQSKFFEHSMEMCQRDGNHPNTPLGFMIETKLGNVPMSKPLAKAKMVYQLEKSFTRHLFSSDFFIENNMKLLERRYCTRKSRAIPEAFLLYQLSNLSFEEAREANKFPGLFNPAQIALMILTTKISAEEARDYCRKAASPHRERFSQMEIDDKLKNRHGLRAFLTNAITLSIIRGLPPLDTSEYNLFQALKTIKEIEETVSKDPLTVAEKTPSLHWPTQLGVSRDYVVELDTKNEVIINTHLQMGDNSQFRGVGLIGQGNSAQVLIDDKRRYVIKWAYKSSPDVIMKEGELLRRIHEVNPNLQNVVKLIGIGEMYLRLEFIPGKTLQQLLDVEKKTFSAEQTLHYAAGIFSGLQEIRRVNVYHRDLWLGNVMIDEEQDRTVIIDLGIATDDPRDGPLGNRRYGGENDLQSLGQIIHKMYTGKHPFNPSINVSTRYISDRVKEERERVYQDPSTLERRLQQIDHEITYPTVAEIEKISLTAKGMDDDYALIQNVFVQAGYLWLPY